MGVVSVLLGSKFKRGRRVILGFVLTATSLTSYGQNVIVHGSPPFCNQVNLTLEVTGLACSAGTPAEWVLHNESDGSDVPASSQPGSPCELGWTFGPGCWSVTVSVGGVQYEVLDLFCVEQPVAGFTISETNICEGGCVEIADASTSPGSPIDQWQWAGLPCADAALGAASFTCCLPAGTYSPQLTVYANGCPALDANGGTITVSDDYPVAAITPASMLDCPGPLDLVLTNSSSGGPFTSSWSITDAGGTEVCSGADNTLYCNALPEGTFQACLEVTNTAGCVSDTCIPVTIFDEPQLSITVNPATTCASTCVSLTANALPASPQTVTWSILDGNGSPLAQLPPPGASVACYTFPVEGTYTVQATATYSGTCSMTTEQTVVVHEPLVADFLPAGDTTFCAPFTMDLTNQSSGTGTLGYQWLVDGVLRSTDSDPSLLINSTSTVALEVSNELGCTTSQTMDVTVDLPELSLSAIPFGACAGVDICPQYALDLSPASEAISNWSWTFGDGFSSNMESPCHAYSLEGPYTICLTITTVNGCTATACKDITVSPALNANFGPTPQTVCAGDGVYFEADNTGGTTYSWGFNGDSCSFSYTSSYPSLSVLPNCTGCFDVTLTINNAGCAASQTIEDAVCFYGPVVRFGATQSCNTPFEVAFDTTYLTYDVATLEWDFNGDGMIDLSGPADSAAIVSPTWDYSVDGEGTYNVCVTAYPVNYPNTCSYTRCRTVYIDDPSANLLFSDNTGCPQLCVAFTPDNEPYVVAWDVSFGNGDTLHAVAAPDPPLSASNPLFYYTNWNGFYGPVAALVDIGSPFSEGPFPAPPYSPDQPCISYDNAGTYTVTAIATNINGCTTTMIYEDAITISSAPDFATFTYDVTSACDTFCVDVIATNVLSLYQWSYRTIFGGSWIPFGGNVPNTELCALGVSSFLEVRLEGDQGSCSDSQTMEVAIPPVAQAAFSISDDTPCQGQEVTFTTTGQGTTGHSWAITGPDGQEVATGTGTSIIPSPSPFTTEGVYTVCLGILDGLYGCADTLCQNVEVHVPAVSTNLTLDSAGCSIRVTACPDQAVQGSSYIYTLVRQYPLPVETTMLPTNPVTYCAPSGFLTYGVYDILVEVSGPGGWNDCTRSDTIHDILNMGDVLGPWTWTPLDSVNCSPYCVQFAVYDTTETGYQYVWNARDGSPTTSGAVVEHCYLQPGAYAPNLQVVFPNGCGPFFQGDTIHVLPYEVSMSSIDPICEGECASVEFTADNPDFGIQSVAFSPSTGVMAQTPQPPWGYDLCPTATTQYGAAAHYAQCVDTVDLEVLVNPLPVLTADPYGPFCINEGLLPCPSTYPAPGSGSGDSWSPACPINPIVLLGGDHIITYHYTDAFGCTDSLHIPFTINDTTAVAFVDSMHACVGADSMNLQPFVELHPGTFQVNYSGVPGAWVNEPSGFFHPLWGTTMPCPTVEVPVRYNYTSSGCTSRNDSVILLHPLPQPLFTANDICAYDSLNIINTSAIGCDSITDWQWTIPEHGSPITENVGPFLYAAGTRTITLSATSNYGCADTYAHDVVVHPVPVAAFSAPDSCQYDAVPYTDQSTIAAPDVITAWHWGFGGSPPNADSQNPAHTWQDYGDFTVTLTVTSDFGCVDMATRAITIHPAPVDSMLFMPNCFEGMSTIQSFSTIPQGTIESTIWTMEDDTLFGTAVAHLFSAPGFFPVQLRTVSDQGCASTITDTIEIWPLPVVDYTLSQQVLCANGVVVFSDASSIPPPYHNTAWSWFINDSLWGTGETFEQAFRDNGTYDVALVVTTGDGCSDTLASAGEILVHPLPVAGFVANPSHTDIQSPEVQFTDSSMGAVHWFYHFGDGAFSSAREPFHRYSTYGSYLVQQVVTNEFDCTDTAYAQVIIDPEVIIYVPNTFTPDGDGVNDVFKPSLDGFGVMKYEFTVWDRWGERIFETTDANHSWDGQLNGRPVQDGVYVWKLEVTALEFVAPRHLIGHVTVLR